MSEMKFPRINVSPDGPVRVESAYIHREGDGVAAIYVDLSAKRATVDASGNIGDGPCVMVGTDANTLNAVKGSAKELTIISFPEYGDDWTVFAAEISRYTLAVCIARQRPIE